MKINLHIYKWIIAILAALICLSADISIAEQSVYLKKVNWRETLENTLNNIKNLNVPLSNDELELVESSFRQDFPIQSDWTLQDYGKDFYKDFLRGRKEILISMINHAVSSSPESVSKRNFANEETKSISRLIETYESVCFSRRFERLSILISKYPKIVFAKHHTIRPSFFAYTEGQSDAQSERHFLPDSSLCFLEFHGTNYSIKTLIEDKTGAIRDPAVSWDGRFILYAHKKSLNEDDYHIYEYDTATGKIRQITFGKGFADYEPASLPNGDIIFSSTRCVQTVDCWWTEVSNLYRCDRDGKFLRRLCFDQVHTISPSILDDGRVIYTRWDYNDRGQIFTQSLFQMNPDGTRQSEFYGNNSWFPTTIVHSRGIHGTQKVIAIFCGHHTTQAGKLGIINPEQGRHENKGAQLIAPIRYTPAERIDGYGQDGELFQYPFPLEGNEFLVTYAPFGWDKSNKKRGDADFGIYWMDMDGNRELLVYDPQIPCTQPVVLSPRKTKPSISKTVDYLQNNGTFYIQDIYSGNGLSGVARGTIKKIRIVALQYRVAGIGENHSGGPAGGALISTPISIGNGSWDVKVVLGEAKVYEDGSAFFIVPARTPVYFQALDEMNRAVQTMRSWATLMPGENQSCVGCHEHKNSAPPIPSKGFTLALKSGAQKLETLEPCGFSYPKEVQPILDKHCVKCHNNKDAAMKIVLNGGKPALNTNLNLSSDSPFSLTGDLVEDKKAKRQWALSYLVLTGATPEAKDFTQGRFIGNPNGHFVNWISSQSVPTPLPAYYSGSPQSKLINLLLSDHNEVQLSEEELDKLICWIDLLVPYCGDYTEANIWTQKEMEKYNRYLNKRKMMEAIEQQNIRDFIEQIAKQIN